MALLKEEIGVEKRISPGDPIIKDLAAYGILDPKFIFIYGPATTPKMGTTPSKVHVLYLSDADYQELDLSGGVIKANSELKLKPSGNEVIKTIYPDGDVGYCGMSGGIPFWRP